MEYLCINSFSSTTESLEPYVELGPDLEGAAVAAKELAGESSSLRLLSIHSLWAFSSLVFLLMVVEAEAVPGSGLTGEASSSESPTVTQEVACDLEAQGVD